MNGTTGGTIRATTETDTPISDTDDTDYPCLKRHNHTEHSRRHWTVRGAVPDPGSLTPLQFIAPSDYRYLEGPHYRGNGTGCG